MKLFINSGVCKYNAFFKIERLKDKRIKLQIKSLSEEGEYEYINFIMPLDNEDDLKKDVLLQPVSLKCLSRDTFEFRKKPSSKDKHIYVMIRNVEEIFDDIFIPTAMKSSVQMIKRIRFIDYEEGTDKFLSNLYFIKISLKKGQSLPVYLTCMESDTLDKHYVFYRSMRDGKYRVSPKLKTLILLNNSNKQEYISLSEFCNK